MWKDAVEVAQYGVHWRVFVNMFMDIKVTVWHCRLVGTYLLLGVHIDGTFLRNVPGDEALHSRNHNRNIHW